MNSPCDEEEQMPLPPLVEPAARLTKAEVERYSRHLIIPDVGMIGQKRLKNAKVLCVGAGGLGSPALMYLAAAGVGTLGIVDFDVVDESNLQRQVIHGQSDVGRSKAESARDSVKEINPLVQVNLHQERLDSSNAMQIFADYDLIVDGTDNFATRYLVNDACVLLGKPYVWGSIYRFDGPLVGRLMIYDALEMTYRAVKVRKDPECPLCGKNPTITELIDYEALCGTVSDEAQQAAAGSTITASELKSMQDRGEQFLL